MSLLAISPGKQFTPKYVDLAHELMRQIAAGPLEVGDRLGTEQELSKRFSLSRVTVRQALELLEKEGYVIRRRARGTFVAREVEGVQQFGLSAGRVLLVCSNEQRCHIDEDSAFCTVLRAIEQSLAQRRFAVQILSVGQNPREDRQRLLALVAQQEITGVLSIGPCLEPYADLLTEVKVVTSCSFYPTCFPWVGDDVGTAAYQSVRHLLSCGHRRIAMLCGDWIDGLAFASFAEGYIRALTEFEVKVDRSLMMHAYPGESLEEVASATFSTTNPPTAIFCENSRVCQAALRAAASLNLVVPADLSVVGYGQNVCEIHDPVPVTAYVPETAKVGEQAVELLTCLLNGKDYRGEPVVIPGRLVERASVTTLSKSPT